MRTGSQDAQSASVPSLKRRLKKRARIRRAFLLNFMVEKEDSVYPMIPAGSALHEMIRRPGRDPLEERGDDK